MKTYKNLYPQVYAFDNLYLAFRAARKGKRDRVVVASFEFGLETNLLARFEATRLMDEIAEQLGLGI